MKNNIAERGGSLRADAGINFGGPFPILQFWTRHSVSFSIGVLVIPQESL